jgi:hypothetical protein
MELVTSPIFVNRYEQVIKNQFLRIKNYIFLLVSIYVSHEMFKGL